ncbi:MAG: discoidin domain-containing protein [Planctomycetota bacterium]|jgi:hypothetical protein
MTPRDRVEALLTENLKEYSIAPLWYWNDDLREEELVRQLKLMKEQHVYQAMPFPMAGLNQPYPSPQYFEMIRFAVLEAKKLDLKMWFYDEYCWPSGLAGGVINEKYPEYIQPSCRCFKYPLPADSERDFCRALPDGNIIFAEAVNADGTEQINILDCVGDNSIRWKAPAGEWEITLFTIAKVNHVLDTVTAARWSNNAPGFIDCLNREAMDKYLELVYEQYYKAVPEEFGKTVMGFWFDEPSMRFEDHGGFKTSRNKLPWRAGGTEASRDKSYQESLKLSDDCNVYGAFRMIPWTRDMLHIFKEKYNYDLRPHLSKLASRNPEDRKICYDFYLLASDLFAENYSKTLGDWCGEHNVSLTGHFGEGAPDGDHYKQFRPMQVPGIDLLGDVGAVNTHLNLPRKASSAAKMLGKKRVMAETYGVTDWTFELSDKIAAADLLNIQGIDLIAPIDYAYSFRSFRKHTSNPPGFYQSPNWKYQNVFSDHTARLSSVVASGASAVKTAVFHSAAERLSHALVDVDHCQRADDNENMLLRMAHQSQIEVDILFDTALQEDAEVKDGWIIGASVKYNSVILPSLSIITEADLGKLYDFVSGGGTLTAVYQLPVIGPDGSCLKHLWKELFRLDLENEKINSTEETACGKGRLILVGDPCRMISVSDLPHEGEVANLFDDNEAFLCFNPDYPHWIAVDFGKELTLSSFTFTTEEIKRDIEYHYQLQSSEDGLKWTDIASVKEAGASLKTELPEIKTRYFRFLVTEGGGRFLGVPGFEIAYRDEDGNEKIWFPEEYDPLALAGILPEALPKVKLIDPEAGKLASGIVSNNREDGDRRIVSLMNNTPEERHLTAEAEESFSVEVLDLEDGSLSLTAQENGFREFAVTFAPYEVKVFVLDKKNSGEVISLDRRRETVREVSGPWKFKAERQNALPLAVCNLMMADPAYPEKWYEAVNGRIPEEVRLVPFILYKCEFEAEYLPGKEEILFEKNIHAHLEINGKPVTNEAVPDRYLDEFGMSVSVDKYLKLGANKISGMYCPEVYERDTRGPCYHYTKLQPTLDMFLLGDFSVTENCIIEPVERLSDQPWQDQGYPYYSGTGIYSLTIDSKSELPLILEIDAGGSVVEIQVNGRDAGIRISPPYIFDLSSYTDKSSAKVTIEIIITNTLGSFLSGQKVGSLASHDSRHESGLKSVKLIKMS